MKNNIINELRFASKKKKNAVLGYVYCDYLLDMFEEIERLNNNWNKLKKWIEEYQNETGLSEYETGISDALYDILKKMKALQGSDKE